MGYGSFTRRWALVECRHHQTIGTSPLLQFCVSVVNLYEIKILSMPAKKAKETYFMIWCTSQAMRTYGDSSHNIRMSHWTVHAEC